MYVTDLELIDFRSYKNVKLSFISGINVLIGTNGQGKTNLVEAVGYLSTLSSHRVASDAPLVRKDSSQAFIRLGVNEGIAAGENPREMTLEIEIHPGKTNKAKQNGVPLTRARDVLGAVQTVLFAPEDLALVKGDPGDRRKFLDETLTQLTPSYVGLRSDLERILKQRNALLKSTHDRNDVDALRTLDVWDSQLASVGARIMCERINLVNALQPLVEKAYTKVSDDRGPLEIQYQTALQVDVKAPADTELIEAMLLSALSDKRREEIDRGVTLVGPQRDELQLQLRELPIRGYASHGESWSAALALRLATFDLFRERSTHGDPVLILDDVFAELDEKRRARLVEYIQSAEQTIITAAVSADVPVELDGAKFDVYEGSVTRVT
jgi:DNA replication and repair protein RecF